MRRTDSSDGFVGRSCVQFVVASFSIGRGEPFNSSLRAFQFVVTTFSIRRGEPFNSSLRVFQFVVPGGRPAERAGGGRAARRAAWRATGGRMDGRAGVGDGPGGGRRANGRRGRRRADGRPGGRRAGGRARRTTPPPCTPHRPLPQQQQHPLGCVPDPTKLATRKKNT